MPKCPICGTKIDIRDRYCRICGHKFWDVHIEKDWILDPQTYRLAYKPWNITYDDRVGTTEVQLTLVLNNGRSIKGEREILSSKLDPGRYILEYTVVRRIPGGFPIELPKETKKVFIDPGLRIELEPKLISKSKEEESINEIIWQDGYKNILHFITHISPENAKLPVVDVSIDNLQADYMIYNTDMGKNDSDFNHIRNDYDFWFIGELKEGKRKLNLRADNADASFEIKVSNPDGAMSNYILAIDIGNSNSTAALISERGSEWYLLEINNHDVSSKYILPSRIADYPFSYNGEKSTARDLGRNIVPPRFIGKRHYPIKDLKNKLAKAVLAGSTDEMLEEIQMHFSQLAFEIVRKGLWLWWENGGSKVNITKVAFSAPINWPEPITEFIKNGIREALDNIGVRAPKFVRCEEGYASLFALRAINPEKIIPNSFILIWDFGGSTTDVTLFHIDGEGEAELVGWNGAIFGGIDIDKYLVEKLQNRKIQGISEIGVERQKEIYPSDSLSSVNNKDAFRLFEEALVSFEDTLKNKIDRILNDLKITGNLVRPDLVPMDKPLNGPLYVLITGGASKLKWRIEGDNFKTFTDLLMERLSENGIGRQVFQLGIPDGLNAKTITVVGNGLLAQISDSPNIFREIRDRSPFTLVYRDHKGERVIVRKGQRLPQPKPEGEGRLLILIDDTDRRKYVILNEKEQRDMIDRDFFLDLL